jgi:hypothetical protein
MSSQEWIFKPRQPADDGRDQLRRFGQDAVAPALASIVAVLGIVFDLALKLLLSYANTRRATCRMVLQFGSIPHSKARGPGYRRTICGTQAPS